MAGKIKMFLELLEKGKSKEEAQKKSGVAEATATIQHKKWSGKWGPKGKKVEKKETKKEE